MCEHNPHDDGDETFTRVKGNRRRTKYRSVAADEISNSKSSSVPRPVLEVEPLTTRSGKKIYPPTSPKDTPTRQSSVQRWRRKDTPKERKTFNKYEGLTMAQVAEIESKKHLAIFREKHQHLFDEAGFIYGGSRSLKTKVYPDGSVREFIKQYTPYTTQKRRKVMREFRETGRLALKRNDRQNPDSVRSFTSKREAAPCDDIDIAEFSVPDFRLNELRFRHSSQFPEDNLKSRIEEKFPGCDTLLFMDSDLLPIPRIAHGFPLPKCVDVDIRAMNLPKLFQEDEDVGKGLVLSQTKFFEPNIITEDARMRSDPKYTCTPEVNRSRKEYLGKLDVSILQYSPEIRRHHQRTGPLDASSLRKLRKVSGCIFAPQGMGKSTVIAKNPTEDIFDARKTKILKKGLYLTNRTRDCNERDTIILLPTYYRYMSNSLSRSLSCPIQRHSEYEYLLRSSFLKIIIPDDAYLSDVLNVLGCYLD